MEVAITLQRSDSFLLSKMEVPAKHRAPSAQAASLDFSNEIASMRRISLEEMSQVKLMNRTDTKFLLPAHLLHKLFQQAGLQYSVQQIGGECQADYGTVYLDTADLKLYTTHLNGKLNRIKWRVRSYLDSGINFLELKRKTNSGRTVKQRVLCDCNDGDDLIVDGQFIQEYSVFTPDELRPVLQNRFNRITLVNSAMSERVTIDYNISFQNLRTGQHASLPNLAIIEVKQDRTNPSAMREILSQVRVRPHGVSKYCLGISLTDDAAKRNLYKQKIRYIYKLIHSL